MEHQLFELPEELVFHVNYLGGDMPTFTLNFSRPGNQIVGQYYNFVRLGRDGYRRIMESLRATALHLSSNIASMGPFEVVSDGSAIPVLAFTMNESAGFTVFDVSDRLRSKGWQVPAYTMPADAEDIAVLRIVVREGFGMDLADMLLDSISSAVAHFEQFPPAHTDPEPGFNHT
jgi:glutamate decarboxylase